MSRFLLHVDLSRRTLITRDGGTYSVPPLTLGYVQVYAAGSGRLMGTVEPEIAIFEHIYGM